VLIVYSLDYAIVKMLFCEMVVLLFAFAMKVRVDVYVSQARSNDGVIFCLIRMHECQALTGVIELNRCLCSFQFVW
jgi:hypothetical protein